MKINKAIIPIIFIISILSACSSTDTDGNNDGELSIYTSIYPIQYATERIGGDLVSVKTVYPPGVDAHSFEPTSKDMTAIADSNAFFYLGAGMEGFAETAANALANQDVALVEIGKNEELFHNQGEMDAGHDHQTEDDHGHSHGDHDPHIWLDPLRMIEMADIVKKELIELDPEQEAVFEKNFAELKADLLTLDDDFQETLASKADKKVLVSHAAYGYWEERYGIEQIAINGLSSSSEPSQKELTEIIDQAREFDINYIIFEQNTSNRVTEIIRDEIGAEALTIHNLAVLTDEDLANNEDYLTLMEYNLHVLDKAME